MKNDPPTRLAGRGKGAYNKDNHTLSREGPTWHTSMKQTK